MTSSATEHGTHLRLLIDVSGSMESGKLARVRDICTEAIRFLPEGSSFDVVTFNDSLTFLLEDTTTSEDACRRAAHAVADLKADGATDLCAAVIECIRKPAPTSSALVLLSDGLATMGETDSTRLIDLVALANRSEIPIASVAVGGDDADEYLLRQLSRHSKGPHFDRRSSHATSSELASTLCERAIGAIYRRRRPTPDPDDYLVVIALGACREVGRSCYLVRSSRFAILLDCGVKMPDVPPPVEAVISPRAITAVILTHAHADHIGYVPFLVGGGFSGPIIGSSQTREFAEVTWLDENPEVTYNKTDSRQALALWRSVEAGEEIQEGQLSLRFFSAGHILGALSVDLE